jgi:hypothetical protein
VVDLYQLAPARTGLEVEPDQHQQAQSSSCAVAMAWISTSWWYIRSTPSVVGEGKALGVLVTAAPVSPSLKVS